LPRRLAKGKENWGWAPIKRHLSREKSSPNEADLVVPLVDSFPILADGNKVRYLHLYPLPKFLSIMGSL
jgi:hypothetical protein